MTANTSIDLGKFGVLVIQCNRGYVAQARPANTWGAQEAITVFNAEALRVRGPVQPYTGEAYGIAARLAKRYTPGMFDRLAYIFWQRYSDPIYNGDSTHAMRVFAGTLPQIERDLNR